MDAIGAACIEDSGNRRQSRVSGLAAAGHVNELLDLEPMPDVAQIKGDVGPLVASHAKVKTIDMADMIERSLVERA